MPKKRGVEDVWDTTKADRSGGKLLIQLVKATGLLAMDRNGKSDPFVRVEVGEKVLFRSEVHKKTLEPVFGPKDCCLLLVPHDLKPEDDLVLEVRDWDKIGKNEFMGEVRLPAFIANLNANEILIDKVADLKPKAVKKGKKSKAISGQLHFRLYFSTNDEVRPASPPASSFFYKSVAPLFKTGDLILYSNFGLFPSLTKMSSNSMYGSVGVIVRMPNKWTHDDELYVFEVTRNSDGFIDAYKEVPSDGLCIFRLWERLHHIHADRIWWAPLRKALTPEQEDAMHEYLNKLHVSSDHTADLQAPFGTPSAALMFFELCATTLDKDNLVKRTQTYEFSSAAIFRQAIGSGSITPVTPADLVNSSKSPWFHDGESLRLLRCYTNESATHAKALQADGPGGSLPGFALSSSTQGQYGDLPTAIGSHSVNPGQYPPMQYPPSTPQSAPPEYAPPTPQDPPPTLPPPAYTEDLPDGHRYQTMYGAPMDMTISAATLPVQVGGHEGALVVDADGHLRKRTGPGEARFYEVILQMFPALAQFVPAFYGSAEAAAGDNVGQSGAGGAALGVEHSKWIILQNLTSGFSSPCVMDLKMGSSVSPEMDSEKAARTAARDAKTTTGTLGFRVTGMKASHTSGSLVEYRKNSDDSNQLPDESAVVALVTDFFGGAGKVRVDALQAYLFELTKLQSWMAQQVDLQFRSSSLLFVYDADLSSRARPLLKMIDFAHVFQSDPPQQDGAYLNGLKNVIRVLSSIVPYVPSESDDGPPPPF